MGLADTALELRRQIDQRRTRAAQKRGQSIQLGLGIGQTGLGALSLGQDVTSSILDRNAAAEALRQQTALSVAELGERRLGRTQALGVAGADRASAEKVALAGQKSVFDAAAARNLTLLKQTEVETQAAMARLVESGAQGEAADERMAALQTSLVKLQGDIAALEAAKDRAQETEMRVGGEAAAAGRIEQKGALDAAESERERGFTTSEREATEAFKTIAQIRELDARIKQIKVAGDRSDQSATLLNALQNTSDKLKAKLRRTLQLELVEATGLEDRKTAEQRHLATMIEEREAQKTNLTHTRLEDAVKGGPEDRRIRAQTAKDQKEHNRRLMDFREKEEKRKEATAPLEDAFLRSRTTNLDAQTKQLGNPVDEVQRETFHDRIRQLEESGVAAGVVPRDIVEMARGPSGQPHPIQEAALDAIRLLQRTQEANDVAPFDAMRFKGGDLAALIRLARDRASEPAELQNLLEFMADERSANPLGTDAALVEPPGGVQFSGDTMERLFQNMILRRAAMVGRGEMGAQDLFPSAQPFMDFRDQIRAAGSAHAPPPGFPQEIMDLEGFNFPRFKQELGSGGFFGNAPIPRANLMRALIMKLQENQ